MEVKSMKGIKFKDAVIPVKELKKLLKGLWRDAELHLKVSLKGARQDIKEKDMILLARDASDIIWWASQLTLLAYLLERLRDYERKE